MARARPHRRCVGCGRIAPKNELLRYALERGERGALAVADPAARMPGRGAYLCREEASSTEGVPAAGCRGRAMERNAIARTLRCSGTVTLVESDRR